jgi:TetR/AcrR family transcriptional repressor of nem operon
MGHSQSEKSQTHERILEAAAKRFRERGLEGTSISEIMGEAGVTVGGFYKHFPSREVLIAEALTVAFAKTSDWNELASYRLSEAVNQYLLSTRGTDLPACAIFSCLTADIRRSSSAIREILDNHLLKTLTACAASDESLAQNLLSAVSEELNVTYLSDLSSPSPSLA